MRSTPDTETIPPGEAPAAGGHARRTFLATLALWFTLLAVFHAFPQIDIETGRLFFSPAACPAGAPAGEVCGIFPLSRDATFVLLRTILFYLPSAAALLILAVLVHTLRRRGAPGQDPARVSARVRDLGLSIAALLVGPYVLVNLLLKSFSGRPRPNQTDLFGGDLAFMPAGSFAGGCDNNCSFISGEAAGAGWVVCLLPLLPRRLRPLLAPPVIAVCIATPALRIAFGGHYLSDVVLGFLSSIVVYAALTGVAERHARRKNAKA